MWVLQYSVLAVGVASGRSLSAKVSELPGLEVPVTQCWGSFTGYLDVDDGKSLFHWYHEATTEAASKPVSMQRKKGFMSLHTSSRRDFL